MVRPPDRGDLERINGEECWEWWATARDGLYGCLCVYTAKPGSGQAMRKGEGSE